ncbi:peptide transporter PTR2-A [Uncinocarpus reesii 1704]|uniref:Peptide transporter PTR2-A n=1 Tax=Uncinocarpus reesii (strain UAMH 1704) TaxID=336963 RepID=C4JEJ6_UNCRE|nr:peptide transporter PTR2-A [Uncinocarpus reesii 1704]EEP75988.1 peptide transporter PTR2-A [Uncinocarpus reesii 1704]
MEVAQREIDPSDSANGIEPKLPPIEPPIESLSNDLEDGNVNEPTEDELNTLRKVAGPLPWSAFLVAVVELCERFAYYGVTGPFQNYVENPYKPGSPTPGALGLGQSAASGLTSFFQFWCYVTPVFGGIVADQYLGKYNTMVISAVIYVVGLAILVCTALPVAILHNASLGGLVVAMIIIGIGTGGIKANISPLIAEQIKIKKPFVKTIKSGERVIEDPARTIERVYMVFYLCINIGSLSPIATTSLEKHIGFWVAYLLPAGLFLVSFAVIIIGRKYYVVRPPRGSVVPQAVKVIWVGIKNKGNLDAAKPSYQIAHGNGSVGITWDDRFVEEMKRTLVACKLFVYYPIYWVCYQQMLNNFISQAGTMELHGIPNDLMQNIDPITIIIFIPICDRLLYPSLRKIGTYSHDTLTTLALTLIFSGLPFKPITRITTGFFLASLAMAYAAIVQHLIYKAPPCYDFPKECPASEDGTVGNRIHVAVQTPAYLFIGLSEIFASITGLEYAFTKAPLSMKSFVMALFLLTNAFGAALGMALSPTAKNPKLIWMYTGLAVASTIAGSIFWLLYSRYNATEEQMNALEMPQTEDEKPVAATQISMTRRKANDS